MSTGQHIQKTESERYQDNNVGVVAASMRHGHARTNSKDVSDIARQDVLRSQNMSACTGKSRVRSVTEESPDEQDDHFMVYSTHTMDALKSSDIRVPVCIEGTTFDMQVDTAADMSLLLVCIG